MSHIVDAHVAYIKAIADLSRDKVELLERIKRLEESHSWRLIETAPSNYTWILGYDEEHGETGMIIFERGDESEPHWTDGMREWEPTHWMPLPEPPKSKEDKLSVNPIQLLGANLIKAGIGFTTEDKP